MKQIYFLRRADGTGPIKIGCSEYPKGRVAQLNSDHRATFVVLASAPGDFVAERNLHLKFADLRVALDAAPWRAKPTPGCTEWFTAAPELLSYIEGVSRSGVITLDDDECRERQFAARYLAGETLQSIATDNCITRERVRQILRRAGVPSLGMRREHIRYSVAEASAATVLRLARAGKTADQIAAEIGDNPQNVRNTLRRRGASAPRPDRHRPETITLAHKVARDYAAGMKAAAIVEKHSLPNLPVIYRYLRLAGVTPCRLPRKRAA